MGDIGQWLVRSSQSPQRGVRIRPGVSTPGNKALQVVKPCELSSLCERSRITKYYRLLATDY